MSVIDPFRRAREVLGVSVDDDTAAIKRAYRRAIVRHPPDSDAAAFRRVRDAYELLSDPLERAVQMLLQEKPAIEPPVAADTGSATTPPGAACVRLLRLLAMTLDTDTLSGDDR